MTMKNIILPKKHSIQWNEKQRMITSIAMTRKVVYALSEFHLSHNPSRKLLVVRFLGTAFAATNALSWNPNKSHRAMVRMSNVKPMLVYVSLEHLAGNPARAESSTWVGIESAQLPITN